MNAMTVPTETGGLAGPVDEPDAWSLDWSTARPSALGGAEVDAGVACTLFCLGNGRLGVRGAAGLRSDEVPGSYINGFYETAPIVYPEDAYGLARTAQAIQPVPESTGLALRLDGAALGEPDEVSRHLDMRGGTLNWRAEWRLPAGTLVVECQRFVGLARTGLTGSRWTLGWSGLPVAVELGLALAAPAPPEEATASTLDPRRTDTMAAPGIEVATRGDDVLVRLATRRSGLAAVALAGLDGPGATTQVVGEAAWQWVRLTLDATRRPSVTRYVAYAAGQATSTEELAADCGRTLAGAREAGWAGLLGEQRAWLDQFWADTDVAIAGPREDQVALRWNLFQVAQASAGVGERGVGAKGVTGSGYSGHYFWDSEIYVAPLLAHTRPEAARGLVAYRYATLDAARRRAAELTQDGACYPWRTITGEEASAYFLAGTAGYHINAAVAHAVAGYVAATGDEDFLADQGAEILIETARLWASLAHPSPADGQYHLHRVTGPDEYSAMVDDNVYTNVMARHNLRLAADACEALARRRPRERDDLARRLRLEPAEIDRWRAIADAMAVPYDEALGINPQDAAFLCLPPWDFAGTPRENYPLLLHYHPLVIYRHQVLKQADVVMALFLRPGDFPPEVRRRDFDFYEPLTTGDSTLSAIPQAIVAARVGRLDVAARHLRDALRVDLANTHRNTVDGVHIASASGVWSVVVYGFAGLREPEPGDPWDLAFDPVLPPGWDAVRFVLRWRGVRLRVGLTRSGDGVAADLTATGSALRVRVGGELRLVHPA